MGTNLIQNYISSSQTVKRPPEVSVPQKERPKFDIQHELDNKTFIKPLPGKGRLLKDNLFNAPKVMFDDFVYNAKAFGHAVKGDANDHELGKLNDVGLLLGGLGIASYLMTKKVTPMRKGMEFVGFGAFITSMVLWPKIAIQLPAYLIHGVNVQKGYQDSFGRKKPFYQDPQFIPWDLYSDDEINKIGDRLGVPKDIPNRRDFIQERMRKLAIQNNTLWMLTAGIATPVMTGLICNSIEPYLLKHFDKKRNKEADAIISNIDKSSKKYESKDITEGIKSIISKYNGKEVNQELLEELYETLSVDMDEVTSTSFRRDLEKELGGLREYSIEEETAKNISKNIKNTLLGKKYSEEFILSVVPNEDEMVKLLRDKNLFKSMQEGDFAQINKVIIQEITNRYKVQPDDLKNKFPIGRLRSALFNTEQIKNPIYIALSGKRSQLFSEAIQQNLLRIAGVLDNFRAKNIALDKYALLKTGAAPETIIANYWNDVSNTMLKEMGFTSKEIEKVRFDKELMGKLLREKIELIASDSKKYERVVTKLAEKIAAIDTIIKPSDMSSHLLNGGEPTAYEKAVDQVFDSCADSLREANFEETAKALVGNNGDAFGSAKGIQKAFVEERLLGVKSSFNRLLNTLDFFRRVSVNPNQFNAYDNRYIPREIREELIELCKNELLCGHSSDHAVKFYMLRNPNPNLSDMSPIEVENGKIRYKYVNNLAIQRTDIPNDKHFYQDAMKYMYEDDIHSETRAILEKVRLDEEVSNYRKLVLDILGGEKYFWKPYHRIRPERHTGSDIKFLLTGISPEEFFYKSGQQFFNSNKWLKIFGGIGGGLLAVTVLAQFFLGKIKNPKQVKND